MTDQPSSIKQATSAQRGNNVTKSPYDDRNYKYTSLKNGLRVLLINDPETEKAAACLSLNVGSLCDPPQLPGLAHFCEHMIFLGSEKYPQEHTYTKYVSEHGGQCSACTKSDETSFSFEIKENHLTKALDMFANFFIRPLFTESATEREINAIQVEHEKNSCNDTRRLYQLERYLSLPGHDYSRFMSGNRFSLFQSACARGMNLQEQLLKFYRKWYSANLMALVVLGSEPVEKLEAMVRDTFSLIPNFDVDVPEWEDSPWVEVVLKKKIYMTPLTELNQLHLMWPIEDYTDMYASRPTAYVTHLLGHEGHGSLLSMLKKLGWVNRLSCGVSRPGKGFASIILSMDLTENGLGHADDIVTKVYQYLKMLRSQEPQEWIFLENQALNNLHFRFKDKEPPYEYVVQLATNLHRFAPQDVLRGPYLLRTFEPQLIKDVLGCLHASNSRLFLVSRSYQAHCNDIERWYNTHYLRVDIPEKTIQAWQNVECDFDMTLPSANKYIATDFTIYPRPKDFSTVAPELLMNTDLSRLWYYPDSSFGLPKAFVTFHIISPLAFFNPLKTLLTALYVELFEDHIGEEAYNCLLAGMVVEIRRTTQGIKLSFTGYSHKLGLLIRNVIDTLIHFFTPSVDRYRCMREEIWHEIANFGMKASYQQAGIYLTNVITDRSWINDELAASFPEITFDLLTGFIQEFYSQLFIEILAYGNITLEDALSHRDLIEGAFQMQFGTKPLGPTQITMARETILPGQTKAVFQRLTQHQPNSAICYYLQGPRQSTRKDAVLNLFCEIINEHAQSVLKTEEQLGHIVYTGARRSNTLQGFRCIIQSNMRPDELERSIDNFLYSFRDTIIFMSAEEFQIHVDSLTSRLLEKPKNMTEKNARFWSEIACHHYNFKRQLLEAEILKEITLTEMLEFFDHYISPSSNTRKKLSVHVVSVERHGCNLKSTFPAVRGDLIRDHNKFKDGCKLSDLAQPFVPLKPLYTDTDNPLHATKKD
ncbi:hypothetical protein T265_04051 [Opisthorchis viverrini]|uniref:Peptidase M16 inactive domain protein n=1 Tax=Opisthorchis viverrini TaxID=6198 RepID=A0A074ZQD3_OPIVI|nr:hypothetical protein T265_04051 [Opisthorchis viverrini]KER29306.1 hypothetical protein T265_04051 [Opisthorchis viverrini]